MATTGLREPDSVKLLSDQVRAFRAKVIAYLMTPKPNGEGYDLDQVVEAFKGSMEDVCEDFWDEGVTSSDMSADLHHLRSWEYIIEGNYVSKPRRNAVP